MCRAIEEQRYGDGGFDQGNEQEAESWTNESVDDGTDEAAEKEARDEEEATIALLIGELEQVGIGQEINVGRGNDGGRDVRDDCASQGDLGAGCKSEDGNDASSRRSISTLRGPIVDCGSDKDQHALDKIGRHEPAPTAASIHVRQLTQTESAQDEQADADADIPQVDQSAGEIKRANGQQHAVARLVAHEDMVLGKVGGIHDPRAEAQQHQFRFEEMILGNVLAKKRLRSAFPAIQVARARCLALHPLAVLHTVDRPRHWSTSMRPLTRARHAPQMRVSIASLFNYSHAVDGLSIVFSKGTMASRSWFQGGCETIISIVRNSNRYPNPELDISLQMTSAQVFVVLAYAHD